MSFADESIDLFMLVAVLPEIPDKDKALREISRVLKPNGILAVSELLIDPDYPLKRTTRRYCGQAGFQMVGASGNCFSYTLRFKKAGSDI